LTKTGAPGIVGAMPWHVRFADWLCDRPLFAKLWLIELLRRPPTETPVDRAIREEGDRLRQEFPTIDFDHPGASARRPAELWVQRLISDLDIYRAANLMIRQHGDDAELRAAQRTDLMLERGDRDGQLVWQRIMRAIGELNAAPSGPLH
jgi:hypothetical protein